MHAAAVAGADADVAVAAAVEHAVADTSAPVEADASARSPADERSVHAARDAALVAALVADELLAQTWPEKHLRPRYLYFRDDPAADEAAALNARSRGCSAAELSVRSLSAAVAPNDRAPRAVVPLRLEACRCLAAYR